MLIIVALAIVSTAPATALVGEEHRDEARSKLRFNRDIRPILSQKCFSCHGPDANKREAGLRLDTAEGAYAMTEMGSLPIIPGDPEGSEILWRITSEDDFDRMPPEHGPKPLNEVEVRLIRTWIEQGAEYERHWAFTTPSRPELPEATLWSDHPIDRFIARRHRVAGLDPSPEADPVTLARRLYLDLTGLPPTPEQVDAYLNDPHPDAYRRLVDRLLDSPPYGERMAIYWLDLVRYADTVGYHGDQTHSAAPYRDWVITAFNENMPFDQFTAAQLAGDLLPESSESDLIASAYNRILQTTHEGGAQNGEYLAKYSSDRVRNFSAVWLGVTLGCAECHDHKYDPLTQRDFYSMAAFFADIREQGAYKAPNALPTTRLPEVEVLSPLYRKRIEQIEAILDQDHLEQPDQPLTAQRREELIAERDQLLERRQRVMVTERAETPRTIRILNRGDWMDTSGEVVEPAGPEIFQPVIARSGDRSDRLDLARWLTRSDHPLTSRTMVNRLWYLFMGEGLTDSLQDVGSQGGWPSHPELLDWLAMEFAENGWDVQELIRTIVTSKTYRQSSVGSRQLRQVDPKNIYFARQSRYRLPAEMIRDSALAISGLLVTDMGGPAARPYQPQGYYAHLNFPKRTYVTDENPNQYRRGVYVHWQRQFLHPMLRAFDAPSREECTARRPASNTPIASLVLMNDPTFVEAARAWAERLLTEVEGNDEDRLVAGWRRAVSRNPDPREMSALSDLLQQSRTHYRSHPEEADRLLTLGLHETPSDLDPIEVAAWTQITRALLNLSETITRS